MSEWTPPANAVLVEENVDTNDDSTTEVEATEEWTPPANATLVEEKVDPEEREKKIKEAKTWITPKMVEEAKKEFGWEDGEITDDNILQAWDLFKSKELSSENEKQESAPVFNSQGEIIAEEVTEKVDDVLETEITNTTVQAVDDLNVEEFDFTTAVADVKFDKVNALSKKRFKNEKGEQVGLDGLNDYLTKKGENLNAQKEKDFELALGKPLADFKTDDDGSPVLETQAQVNAYNDVVKKYQTIGKDFSKEVEDANALIDKYSVLGNERNRKRKLKELEKAAEKEKNELIKIQEEGTGKIYSYQKAKELYVDLPKSKGEKGFESVEEYIKAFNRGVGRKGNKLSIETFLEEFEITSKATEEQKRIAKNIKRRRKSSKWWNDLLSSSQAEAIFTFSQAKGKDYIDHFLPNDFEVEETGSIITDWVTVTHKPTGESIEIGFDYDAEDKADIKTQQRKLRDFLLLHSDEEDLKESFGKAKNAYALYKEAEQTPSNEGGFNIDWKKEGIYDKYSKISFEPELQKIERKGSRVVSSATDDVVDKFMFDKVRKEMSEDEKIAQAKRSVKQQQGYRKIYNPVYTEAQREALEELIQEKKSLGLKAGETVPLEIGAGGNVVRPATKGLGITQMEVDTRARKILADQAWETEQRRAFENYIESDKYWNQEEKDQTRIMFGNIMDRSKTSKKAIASNAMFTAKLDELEEFEANPTNTTFTKEFKEFSEDKNAEYIIEEGESYYVIDKRKVPAYVIDGARTEQETYKKLIRNVEIANGAAQWSLDQVPKFDEKWEIYSKNYNDLERAGKALVLGIGDVALSLGYGVYKLHSYTNPYSYLQKYLGIEDPLTEGMLKWSSFKQKELSEYAPVARFGEWNGFSEFGSYWMNVGAEQAPIYLTMMAANMIAPGSGFAIAATAGLTNLGQTDIRMREEVALGLEEYSEWDLTWRPLVSGMNEGVFTYFGTAPLLRKGGNILKGRGGDPFKKFATGKRNYMSQQFPGLIGDGAKEIAEESIIAINDNILWGRTWNENLDETAVIAGALGITTTGAPMTYALMSNNFTNGDQLNKLSESVKAKADVYNENKRLRDENAANMWEAANTNDKTKKAELKQIIDNNNSKIESNLKVEEQLNNEQGAIYEEIDNNIKNQGLGKDSYESYATTVTEMAKIKTAAQQVSTDKSKSDKQKTAELKVLGEQYTNMKNALDIYTSTKLFGHGYYSLLASSFVSRKNKRRIQDIRGEATTRLLNSKGSNYEISPKELNVESAKIYIEQEVDKQLEKDQRANKDLKVADTKADAVELINNHYDPKIKAEENAEAKKELVDNKKKAIDGINKGLQNGVYLETGVTEEFIVIKETMVNNEKLYTGSHENTHGWTAALMKKDPKAFKELGNQIVKYMQTKQSDVWQKMLIQNPNIQPTDPQSEYYGKTDLEEVISSFVEEIGAGNIKLNKRGVMPAIFGQLLNKGIKTASKGKNEIPFKGQNDIVNWFTSVGQSIVDGNINLRKDSDVKVTDENVIKQKESARRAGDTINSVIAKTNTAAEVQAEVYQNFLSEQAPANTAKLIDNIIKQQLSKEGVNVEGVEANVYNKPLDQFVQEVKDVLLEKSVMRFNEDRAVKNPDGSFDVGGYLISELVKYRIGDVLKKYRPKAGETSIDITDSEGRVRQYEDVGVEQDIINRIDEGEQMDPESTFRRGIKFQGQDQTGLTDEKVESFREEATKVSEELPSVKDKKFRPKLDQLAGTKLKKWVKDNVFKGQKYDTFIEDNYNLIRDLDVKYLIDLDKGLMKQGKERAFTKPVRRLTTQEDIRKYKDSGRVYVEEEAQGVMLYDVLDPGIDFMMDFFTKEMPSTVSNRKGKLAEAFGRKMFKDILPEIKSKDNISTAEKSKISEKIQRDPRLKFSQSEVESKFVNLSDQLNNIVKQAGAEVLLRGKDGVDYMNNFIIEDLTAVFGPAVYSFIRPSTLAGAGNNVIGKKPNSGAIGRGFMYINDATKSTYAPEVTIQYVNDGVIGTLRNLKSKLEEKGITPLTKKEQTAVEKAVVSQNITTLQRNLDNLTEHKKGVKDIIEGLREVFDLNNDDIKGIRELIYHPNANASFGRNMAAVLGLQKGAKPGNSYEEHVFQFGNFAIRTLQAISNKNRNIKENGSDQVLDNYINWLTDNYYQIAFTKDKVNQTKVDGTYDVSRFNPEEKLEKWKSKSEEHPLLRKALDEAFRTGDFSKVPTADIRFYNEYFYLNPNEIVKEGITDAKKYNVEVSTTDAKNESIVSRQAELIFEVIKGNLTKADAGKQLNAALPYLRKQKKPTELNTQNNNNSKVVKQKASVSNEASIRQAEVLDRALNIARDPNAPVKKIRVFDFDDTLARTKSNVLYTMPDGTTGKLTAEEFAKKGDEMVAQGVEWDFSEFNKVMQGKKGPLLGVAKLIQQARGTKDVFVLTARSQLAAPAIKEFLDSVGLNIPIENITGLGDSSPLAKSGWIVGKAAEGYNDFYFADDHLGNVDAVKIALDVIDVKSKVQQAKVKFSLNTKRDLKWKNIGGSFKIKEADFEVNGKDYQIEIKNKDVGHIFSKLESHFKSLGLGLTHTQELADDNLRRKELSGDKPTIIDAAFYRITESYDTESGIDKDVDLTGEGNAAEVMSIVANGLVDKYNKTKGAQGVTFTAFEQSRVRLYRTLANMFSRKLGLKVLETEFEGVDGPNIEFLLLNKELFESVKDPARWAKRTEEVQKVLDVVDVKSDVQKAKVKFSSNADKMMNNIIYQSTGIEQYKEFSEVAAQARGRKKKSFSLIPPSAQDFGGLLYKILAKGKQGDTQWQWMQDNLMKPYGRAMNDLSVAQNQLMADFRSLKKSLKGIPKNLKKTGIDGFTNEDVVRVMAWDRQGIKIEGLSKRDLDKIKKYIETKPELNAFVTELIAITKGDGYHYPGATWLAGTITTDFMEGLRKTTRPKLLKQWQENIDLAFNESNMNKLEAAFGSNYREALENSLERMKTGRNRRQGMGRLEQRFLDYMNNSIGAVMFFNSRSAILQTISAANFVNWSDNNPMKAGAAFANQPQYWKDFVSLMNSDFLVDRRNGLKINVSESEIAEAAKTAGNSVKGVITYLLNKGFLFTQIADSFAIASGGATFYRNRINTYKKQGMSEAEATEKAFLEFRELAEESQQSSRADKISQQQSSTLGRLVLAFANTPSQYARIMDKAGRDLINGRGDWKSNISRIMYYGFVQNLLFTTLQQAMFAVAGEEDEEEIESKTLNAANSMLDNLLRGVGVHGTIISAAKNTIIDLIKRSKKDPYFNPDASFFPGPKYEESLFKLVEVSPPLSIKLKKYRSGMLDYQYNRWRPEAKEPFNINNPNYRAASKVTAAVTNVPLDRLFQKIENVQGALDATNEPWQRVAMALGWPKWQLETSGEKGDRKEEEKEQKRNIRAKEKPSIYTKDEQINILKQYELTDEEIEELKNEDLRVNKIQQLRDSTKVVHVPMSAQVKPKNTNVKNIIKPKTDTTTSVVPKTDTSKVTFITPKPQVNKNKRKKIKIQDRTTRQARLYKLSKGNQVDTLKSLGVTPAVIKTLKYEEDRVRKIEELYDKN